MPWEPTTDQEFDEWIRPLKALDVFDAKMAEESDKRALLERLKAGVIVGVARQGWALNNSSETQEVFVRVPARAWRAADPNDEAFFWESGDLVSSGIYDSYRFFDVRFHPDTFFGRSPTNRPDTPPQLPPVPPENAAPKPDNRKNLTVPEATRFCDFLVAEMPDVTDREAFNRATAFYSDRKVPRDWFWDIFRPIRGKRNPGRRPKIRD